VVFRTWPDERGGNVGDSVAEPLNTEDGVGFAEACLLGQLFDREAKERVDPIRNELGGRFEGETPLVQSRVGKVEIGTAAHRGRGHQKVEIENSGPPSFFHLSIAAGSQLELTSPTEQ
jgi:hypothetical protein